MFTGIIRIIVIDTMMIDTELKLGITIFTRYLTKHGNYQKQTNRHQFIELPVPTKISTYNNFIKAEAGLNKTW